MPETTPNFPDNIEELLNNATPGTARAKLGTIIVGLMADNAALKSEVATLTTESATFAAYMTAHP